VPAKPLFRLCTATAMITRATTSRNTFFRHIDSV
jgi:hypothetical protein